jgi:hypothetical protein
MRSLDRRETVGNGQPSRGMLKRAVHLDERELASNVGQGLAGRGPLRKEPRDQQPEDRGTGFDTDLAKPVDPESHVETASRSQE